MTKKVTNKRREEPVIRYLNTDLEIESDKPFDKLARFLDNRRSAFALEYGKKWYGNRRGWAGWFELQKQYATPEGTIAKFISILESLRPDERREWDSCRSKLFDIGYDCGDTPWAFQSHLSRQLIDKVSEVGAGIGITLYPENCPYSD